MSSVPTRSATVPHDPLADSPFLSGIPGHNRKLILAAAEQRMLSPKNTVIRSGAKATHLFLRASGKARYYRVTGQGRELVLRWLVPGDVFGLGSLLSDPPPYMGSVEVSEESEVYVWKHACVCDLCCAHPQKAKRLANCLGYLADYAKRHGDLVTHKAEHRLAHALIGLAERAGHAHSGAVHVNVTNEQLGNLSDVGMFTTTRLLKKWERQGAIAKKRNRILILAPEKLDID
jgi:CRP/FNR family transcriptional regulator, nitrogen oxide reductase regulator